MQICWFRANILWNSEVHSGCGSESAAELPEPDHQNVKSLLQAVDLSQQLSIKM